MKLFIQSLALGLLLVLPLAATAQGAANDAFADRVQMNGLNLEDIVIDRAGNRGTGREAGEPSHAGQGGGASVWWVWTAPRAGKAIVDLSGSSFDTLLGVYFGKELNSLSTIASDDDGGSAPGTSKAVLTVVAGKDYLIAVDGKRGATGDIKLHLRLITTPEISLQPVDQVAPERENTSFRIEAIGHDPLNYQWNFKGVPIAGQTSPTLNLSAVTDSNAGSYTVIVRNSYGEVESDEATLTISKPPVCKESPRSQTVDTGGNVTFSVVNSGAAPFTYQWQHNGVNLVGETGQTLSFSNIGTNLAGLYQVIVRNAFGTTNCGPATLTVIPKPPAITLQPRDVSILVGNRVEFTVAATGYQPISYFWRRNGVVLTDETDPILVLPQALTNQAGNYSVIVSNAYGISISREAVLVVETRPPNDNFADRFYLGETVSTNVTGFNRRATREPGEPRHVNVNGTNSVWWSWTSPEVGLLTIDSSASSFNSLLGIYTGDTPDNLKAAVPDSARSGATRVVFLTEELQDYIIAIDGVPNNRPEGNVTFSLSFNSVVGKPEITRQPFDLTLPCIVEGDLLAGGTGCRNAVFNVAAASIAPLSYQWKFNGVDIPGATNDTLSIPGFTTKHVGDYTAVVRNRGGSVETRPAKLTGITLPWITSQPQDVTVRDCERVTFSVGQEACEAVTYQWRLDGANLPGATNANFVLPKADTADAGLYSVEVRNHLGPSLSREARLTVNGQPVITTFNGQNVSGNPPPNQSRTVRDCEPVQFTVATLGSCTPQKLQWFFNGTPIPGATNSALAFNATAQNAGGYHVVAQNEGGSAKSPSITLTVNAEPVITLQPRGNPRVRKGDTIKLEMAVQSCGVLHYQWQKNGTNMVIVPNLITGVTSNILTIVNASTNDSGIYRVQVTNPLKVVPSADAPVTVLIAPPNDNFVDRIPLQGTDALTTGFNVIATQEPGEPVHARRSGGRSVWWTWTSPFPSDVTVDLSGSTFDTLLGIYRGDTVDALTEIAFDDQGGSGSTSKVTFQAARGRVIQIAVDGNSAAEGDIRLQLTAIKNVEPPVITVQPESQASTAGNTVTFSVQATGAPDILYQWNFNGTAIPGATNTTLVLSNVQPKNEGNYTVTLQNEFGSVNSFIARLTFGAIVRGQVTDATNGRPIPGAKVSVGDVETFTDENGNYTLFGVRPGRMNADFDARKRIVKLSEPVCFDNRSTLTAVTLRGEAKGYIDYENNQFETLPGQIVVTSFSMSPIIGDGMRFVLNWGLNPADLDVYLETPVIEGTRHTVFYLDTARGSTNSAPYAKLDVDVRKSYGPETVTIHKFQPGTYRFYVKKFGGFGELNTSSAIVKIYTSNGLFGTREVPTSGSGRYWHVCDVIVDKDGITRVVNWVNALMHAPPQPQSLGANTGSNDHVALQQPAAGTPRVGPHARPQNKISYLWDFGDGSTSTEKAPCHPYENPGEYTVSLTLINDTSTNRVSDIEVKEQFIRVINQPPVVRIIDPPSGRILRAFTSPLITAEASDPDVHGRVVKVEFFVNGRLLGTDTTAPYSIVWPDLQEGNYTLTAIATDNHGGTSGATTAASATIPTIVKDLTGDVLIVRNFADPEIDTLVEYIGEMKPFRDEQGRHIPLVARVLDQEGLTFDLVAGFRLIIWHDLGNDKQGLTENDVAIFQRAYEEGIPFYAIGEQLATAGDRLKEPFRSQWRNLTRLRGTNARGGTGMIDFPFTQNTHPILNGQYVPAAEQIPYPPQVEINKADVDGGAEVFARSGDADMLIGYPGLEVADFGATRTFTQNFRVAESFGSPGLDVRKALFQDISCWLMICGECINNNLNLAPSEAVKQVSVGEVFTYSFELGVTGACAATGIVVSNAIPAGLKFLSATNVLGRWRYSDGVVYFTFGKLPSAAVVALTVSAMATQPGIFHSKAFSWDNSIENMIDNDASVTIDVAGTAAPTEPPQISLRRNNSEALEIWITRGSGSITLESSPDLKQWLKVINSPATTSPMLLFQSPMQTATQLFYRARGE